MIFDLYVISKENGVCTYHQGFGSTLVNSDLVAGLLSAMFSFMKEVRGDEIKVMVSGTSRFIFDDSPKLIFAVLVDSYHDGTDASRFLEGVKKLFLERYRRRKLVSPLSEDDPISQDINSLLVAPAISTHRAKIQVKLGRRLTNLVASELTTQRDALNSLVSKVAQSGGNRKTDEELRSKYRQEIENLDRLIQETESQRDR
jgi:hypothetical protein